MTPDAAMLEQAATGTITWPVVEPMHLGPTWEPNPDWDGIDVATKYLLPEITLGWQILDWIEANLLAEESTPEKPIPFKPTREQSRFILWWYAIDKRGKFLYRDGVLQRLKGWGKDPLLAVICAVEFLGPCRFDSWLLVDKPDLDLVVGDPLAVEHSRAWIQIAAVSQEQTTSTMTIFSGLLSEHLQKAHGMHRDSIGKTVIYAHGGTRRIQAVTSSPRALEGARPTFVVRNETHHWVANNDGHEMAGVIERNATKAKGGGARALSITNAYEPSEGSVAQVQRETWEAESSGLAVATGVFYDSLEAPEDARLHPGRFVDSAGVDREPTDAEVLEYLMGIIRAVCGDSTWMDFESIAKSVLDRRNPPSRSRRFWFNQVVTKEDAWVDPAATRLAVSPLVVRSGPGFDGDHLRAGWLVLPSEPIVVFGDGSKSDDTTGLVGCRLSDGYVFTLGAWARPPALPAKEKWVVDRDAVSARVAEIFGGRFHVVGFWFDPSHALDDDLGRFWDSHIDQWHRDYGDRLQKNAWAVQGGINEQSILWDMTSSLRQQQFVQAAESFVEEIERLNDVEEYDPAFQIDGHPMLLDHLRNAIKWPGKFGTSLGKVNRESKKKIDLAVCAVGARMLRRVVLNKGLEEPKAKAGNFWGVGGSWT